MKHYSLCALFVLLLSVVIAVGSVSFLGPCVHDDGSFGACHWAGRALLGTGILLTAESLFTLLCRDSRMRQGAFVPMFLAACLGCLIPGTLIDLCRMATMRCRALMQPAMILLFSISAIISLIGFFAEKRRAGSRA
jgi:H+/Cl- antiporter ClcA